MRIEYGPTYDIASIDFVSKINDGELTRDVRVPIKDQEIYLGFARDGKLLQIEILGASGVLREETLASALPMDETIVRRNGAD